MMMVRDVEMGELVESEAILAVGFDGREMEFGDPSFELLGS